MAAVPASAVRRPAVDLESGGENAATATATITAATIAAARMVQRRDSLAMGGASLYGSSGNHGTDERPGRLSRYGALPGESGNACGYVAGVHF
jgi:hypothetical protein